MHIGPDTKRGDERTLRMGVFQHTDTPKKKKQPHTHTDKMSVHRKNVHALEWAGWSGSVVAQINGVSQY